MHGWEWGHTGGVGFAGGIIMIVFWALALSALALLLVWLLRQIQPGSSQTAPHTGGQQPPGGESARDSSPAASPVGKSAHGESAKRERELEG